MKKTLSMILAMSMALSMSAAAYAKSPTAADETQAAAETLAGASAENKIGAASDDAVSVYVLSGPTGIGSLNLWAESEAGESEGNYNFTLTAANDEIVAAVSNGDADIAAIATNLASTLYNKTDGQISVLAVNTLGVLSLLSSGEEVTSIADLKGRTIYSPGQGANPEYILRYVLTGNGLDPDKDVNLQFVSDGSELASVWSEDPDAILLAPQPMASTLLMKNEGSRTLFDMTEEWNKIAGEDSTLMMGCVIARDDFIVKNPEAVSTFLTDYQASIEKAQTDLEGTAALCESYGIIPNAALAKQAIPRCGLTFISGEDMKTQLSGYLKVMYDANPKSIGGKMPDDVFYYLPE